LIQRASSLETLYGKVIFETKRIRKKRMMIENEFFSSIHFSFDDEREKDLA